MLLAGIDIETTGLDINNDRIVEISAVLWDWDKQVPVEIYSSLVYEEDMPNIDTTFEVSHIDKEMLEQYGKSPKIVMEEMCVLLNKGEYIVSHNGIDFDKPVVEQFYIRNGINAVGNPTWIDTMYDIVYPPMCKYRSLMYLSAYYEFINPFPHRALFDVMSMFKVMHKAVGDNIDEVVARAKSPMLTIQAIVSFNDKDLAKAEKFRWEPDKKIWYKRMKEIDIDNEWLDNLPFEIRILEDEMSQV